jgi:ribosomal protein S18 acetylase RimI-like enzyme
MEREQLLERADASTAAILREDARHDAQGAIDERGGLLLCAGGTKMPLAPNAAMRLDDRTSADHALRRAWDFFAERHSGFELHLRLADRDDELAARAEAAGSIMVSDSPAMVVERPLAPPDAQHDLRKVHDEQGANDYAAVVDDAYQSLGMPAGAPLRLFAGSTLLLSPQRVAFVAYLDGAPAAAAQVIMAADVGVVSWVGTTEVARGRGLGEAVTRAATNAGFEMGGKVSWLGASTMGEPIYHRLGYREFSRIRSVYLWPGVGGGSAP